jgi:hypothetical protein
MKTIILIISGLFSIFNAYGQADPLKPKTEPKLDFRLDTAFSLFQHKMDQQSPGNPFADFGIKDLEQELNIQRRDDPRDRVFPGASKYYAINPVRSYSYENKFIIKPDTTNKYYLIIVNPFDTLVKK